MPGSAVALAVADEIFLRCAPQLTGSEYRFTGAAVVDRNYADVLWVLHHLAEAMESNSEVNLRTGSMFTHVDPEWFGRFERVVKRHVSREGVKEAK